MFSILSWSVSVRIVCVGITTVLQGIHEAGLPGHEYREKEAGGKDQGQ